ncbi:MAG: FUSC family protein [Myxococcota bacterium]
MHLVKPEIGYKPYAIEALKAVIICGLSFGLLQLLGIQGRQLAMGLMIVAQTSFAVFFVPPYHFPIRAMAFPFIGLSAIAGGIAGHYIPFAAPALTIIAAAATFYYIFINSIRVICINVVLVFMIFAYFPTPIELAGVYLWQWFLPGILFTVWHWLAYRRHRYTEISLPILESNERDRLLSTVVCLVSLGIAYTVTALLPTRFHSMHVYWIPMVCLLVTQVTVSSTTTYVKQRISMNILGAGIAAILFYVISMPYWLAITLLVALFYLCLFFMFSYKHRTFCVTVMMVGIYHILQHATAVVMMDRVVFTIIAGSIVLVVSFVTYAIVLKFQQPAHSPVSLPASQMRQAQSGK